MKELITILEEISFGLMENDYDKLKQYSEKLSNSLMTVFPLIIVTYSRIEMKTVSNEALEWPVLLERIFVSMKSDDRFLIVDVLYNETRKKILDFIDITTKMGVAIDF